MEPMMRSPSDEREDIEFLEFQQELERESQMNRDVDSVRNPSLTPISSVLATTNNSDENVFHDIDDDHHEMDVGIDLDLESSNTADSSNDAGGAESITNQCKTQKAAATTPKTVAITEGDDSSGRKRDRMNRRKGIPKNISIQDTAQDDTTAHQLMLLDQQMVGEHFGVYSDLSGEEEEKDLCCLQDAAVVALKASVTATTRLLQDCQNGDVSSIEGLHDGSKYCPTMPKGMKLFATDEDGHVSEKEQSSVKDDPQPEAVDDKTKPDNHGSHQDGDPEELYEEAKDVMDEGQFAVNRSFSSHTQPGTFCQDHCDVMSQYWERIKLALSNRNSDHYRAIDAKSQASLLSCLENDPQEQTLEQKDSLSYSSVGDDAPSSFLFPVLEKCQNPNDSFTNEMDKMISCALPNGLIFCTIWLDHPDYLEQVSGDNLEQVEESDFSIENGCQVVWHIRCSVNKRMVGHAQASDLLRCFSWAGDKDHAVVYQLNQVLHEMRRATTDKDCLEDIVEPTTATETATVNDLIDNEIKIVLWTSPKRIFPHFVNVHGNHVSTVHLVRERKSTLGRYTCGNQVADKSSIGRIVFFVKTFDSIPSLMSAPSDEMEQGEETILEESVFDEEEEEEEDEVCPHDEKGWLATEEEACPQDGDEHHNEEWSVAGRSNVTRMIDNRTRPQRVRYILEDETDEFSERFGL